MNFCGKLFAKWNKKAINVFFENELGIDPNVFAIWENWCKPVNKTLNFLKESLVSKDHKNKITSLFPQVQCPERLKKFDRTLLLLLKFWLKQAESVFQWRKTDSNSVSD